MAGIYTIDAKNVDEFFAALCGARSLEEWEHWGEIAKQTVVPPLDARCKRKFPRSEMNNLPNTAAPTGLEITFLQMSRLYISNV